MRNMKNIFFTIRRFLTVVILLFLDAQCAVTIVEKVANASLLVNRHGSDAAGIWIIIVEQASEAED